MRCDEFIRTALLFCGVLSSLLYGAMVMFIQFKGYDSVSQTVSELSAIGTPTRPMWLILGSLFDALLTAFGIGVWISAGDRNALRVVGVIFVAYGCLGVVWPFASMHSREVLAAGGETFSDTLHLTLVMAETLLTFAAMGFAAASLGMRFRIYSIITVAILLIFGVLTAMEAPSVQANLPTPYAGLWERINIYAFLAWVVVLAFALMREMRLLLRARTRKGTRPIMVKRCAIL